MKLLVTGGAGFIGSHLCDALIDFGHQVVAIDNLSLGRKRNLVHLEANAGFEFVQDDILDERSFGQLVRDGGFDCVFHMAANSDIARSHASPSIDLDNSFLTTFRVLEAMRGAGIKQLVFASTSAIYGEADGEIAEDFGPLQPISHYGAAKLASEAFISSYGENYGIQSWITRFPNVVGSRATHDSKVGWGAAVGVDAIVANGFVLGAEGTYWDSRPENHTIDGPGIANHKMFQEWGLALRAGVLATPSTLIYGKVGYVRDEQRKEFVPFVPATQQVNLGGVNTPGYYYDHAVAPQQRSDQRLAGASQRKFH